MLVAHCQKITVCLQYRSQFIRSGNLSIGLDRVRNSGAAVCVNRPADIMIRGSGLAARPLSCPLDEMKSKSERTRSARYDRLPDRDQGEKSRHRRLEIDALPTDSRIMISVAVS